jgi:hypothetical protein
LEFRPFSLRRDIKTVQVCEETFFPAGRHKTFVIFRRAACRLNNVCGDKSQQKKPFKCVKKRFSLRGDIKPLLFSAALPAA